MITGTNAGFGRRFAALIYDSLLLIALLMIFTAFFVVTRNAAVLQENAGALWYVYRAGLLAVIGGYYVLNWTRSGQTLGMRAWHLRAVTAQGKPLGVSAAVLRFVCGILAWPPAGLGVLWLYVDRQHLALHDRLSKTRVVHLARA